MLKAPGFNLLKARCFQTIGFKLTLSTCAPPYTVVDFEIKYGDGNIHKVRPDIVPVSAAYLKEHQVGLHNQLL